MSSLLVSPNFLQLNIKKVAPQSSQPIVIGLKQQQDFKLALSCSSFTLYKKTCPQLLVHQSKDNHNLAQINFI